MSLHEELGFLSEANQPSNYKEYKFFVGTPRETSIYYAHEEHSYCKIEGDEFVVLPSVTTITGFMDRSAPLMAWAVKLCCAKVKADFQHGREYTVDEFDSLLSEAKRSYRTYTEAAAETGSIAHDYLQRWIEAQVAGVEFTEPLPEDPRAASGVQAALRWIADNNVKFVFTERKIYSPEHGYAGTADALAYVNGVLSLLDWKTSNAIRTEYRFQVAAYAHAIEQELDLDIQQSFVIRLGKENAELEVLHISKEEQRHDLTVFLSLLDSWYAYELYEQREREAKAEAKEAAKQAKLAAKAEEARLKAEAKSAARAERELLKVRTPRRRKAAVEKEAA